MCSCFPITVLSQMAEHHVLETAGPCIRFLWASCEVSDLFFIISSSNMSLVALCSAAGADVGSCRQCSHHPSQDISGM